MLNMKRLEERIIRHRRELHRNAEVGFDLPITKAYVQNILSELGIKSESVGKCGVVATLGNDKNKCVLLRADMDALPIKEELCLEFSSQNGNMHACGHDMHTAMLLGAAEILKSRESELYGTVKLMFQPAEETLEGALDMINKGVLESPRVDAAFMLHVVPSENLPIGSVIVSGGGLSAPSADFFKIFVEGKSSHGANPQAGIDALAVGARIALGTTDIVTMEIPTTESAVLSIGSFIAGDSANTIAGNAELSGTFRCFDESIREKIRIRLEEIADNTARAYRARARVEYTSGTPALKNSGALSEFANNSLKSAFGDMSVYSSGELGMESNIGGSEDFAYVSERVDALMLGIVATNNIRCALHNPKTEFSEKCLLPGSIAYATLAIDYLK